MNKPWQVWLALLAIFAFGGVCGGLVGYQVARRDFRHPPPPRELVMRRIDRLNRKLRPTPEQEARIGPIVQRYTEELTKEWRQSMGRSRAIVERMEKEIGTELTPEQRAKYEQLLKRHREWMRHLGQEWGPRGGRDRPHGVPPDDGLPPLPEAGGPPPPAGSPETRGGT